MLLTITTTGKVTLLIVAGAFVAWALVTAIWIPRRNPDFPVTLTAFLLVSTLFFATQMGAVYWVTSTQDVETEAVAGGGGETTSGETTSGETTSGETTPGETTPGETTPGETTPEPGGEGDVAAGKVVFTSAGCGSCHVLADAGSSGTIGPDLDAAKPAADLVVARVTDGQGVMPAFKAQLTEQQIEDVAAYVASVAGS